MVVKDASKRVCAPGTANQVEGMVFRDGIAKAAEGSGPSQFEEAEVKKLTPTRMSPR